MTILNNIFSSYSQKELKRLNKKILKIMDLEKDISLLSDEELRGKTLEFRKRLSNGETLDSLLVEAFAVCREASSRVLGMKHFEVQLLGGAILHQGRIAEMKTGEGKTLVATLPAYLHALEQKGVHIVTVNEYLAERDLNTLKPLYDYLGVSASVVTSKCSNDEKKQAYSSDIVYITNDELGFDYLRDHMVLYKSHKVQRELNFAIVDEVDSILIDEARTPLIISGGGEDYTVKYSMVDTFVKSLATTDYIIDEKLNTVIITEGAVTKLEGYFSLENYSDISNSELKHFVDQSLKANYLMKMDKDYLVRDGAVFIIDEFTGRISEGRRYSDGLHQAIEAKEGVAINHENKTIATITYQSLFKLYKRLSGMTGTAKTEEIEFREIYALDVVEIPTNMPVRRIDHKDKIYLTINDKYTAILKDVEACYEKGQPVLIGTTSIENSEKLSALLKSSGIPHEVLNAKCHEKEANIISNAGKYKSVTIATNMAGRGTDIKLGEGVEELGGLKIIGSERHENRRIDNQLRGRSGRQGDSGESAFYVSFEDDLMRVFATEKVKNMLQSMSSGESGVTIENKFLSNAIEKAQKDIEAMNFQTRKEVFTYDSIISSQRNIIYAQRDKVVDSSDISDEIKEMIINVMKSIAYKYINCLEDNESFNPHEFKKYFEAEFFEIEGLDNLPAEEVEETIINKSLEAYENKKKELLESDLRIAEKQTLISMVDRYWIDHIEEMAELKKAVRLQAYNQKDPLKAFIIESGEAFRLLVSDIRYNTVKSVLKLKSEHKNNLIYETQGL